MYRTLLKQLLSISRDRSLLKLEIRPMRRRVWKAKRQRYIHKMGEKICDSKIVYGKIINIKYKSPSRIYKFKVVHGLVQDMASSLSSICFLAKIERKVIVLLPRKGVNLSLPTAVDFFL